MENPPAGRRLAGCNSANGVLNIQKFSISSSFRQLRYPMPGPVALRPAVTSGLPFR